MATIHNDVHEEEAPYTFIPSGDDNNNEDYTYNEVEREVGLKPLEIIKLPTYQIANELDKWILAELNQTIKNVDTFLSWCEIDAAIKS